MKFDWKTVFCTGNISSPLATTATNYGHNRFDANWGAVTNATGYYLDVATDVGFTSFVSGFSNKDVGNVTTYDVTGLNDDTTYYYRLRAHNATVLSTNSNTITATTPISMLITSRGTGTSVSTILIGATAGLTLTLTGTAKFYSDSAGTLNESSTWSNANGTRYVRCPSGTAELMYSHIEKLTAAGNCATTNSGNAFFSPQVTAFADSASMNCRTWNYPNCTNIYFVYGAPYIYFSADITELSSSLVKGGFMAGGTITGSWADIPSTCTMLGVSMTNTVSGDTSDIPDSVTNLYWGIGGSGFTGDVADLPAGMLEFRIGVANTISGDVGDLPTTIVTVLLYGSTTLTGDVADIPATVTSFMVLGVNTISGDIADLPAGIQFINVQGNNTISGSLVDIPSGVSQVIIYGSNTIDGAFTSIPASCYNLSISGNNTISGSLADLPSGLTILTITGSNTVSGNLSDLDASITYFYVTGSNTIAGNLSSLPASLQEFTLSGSNVITGDLANCPANCYRVEVTGLNTISDYGHKTWSGSGYTLIINPNSGGLSAAEVDQLLIDLDTDCVFTSSVHHIVTLAGTNGSPTATSAAARASLIAKGVHLTTV